MIMMRNAAWHPSHADEYSHEPTSTAHSNARVDSFFTSYFLAILFTSVKVHRHSIRIVTLFSCTAENIERVQSTVESKDFSLEMDIVPAKIVFDAYPDHLPVYSQGQDQRWKSDERRSYLAVVVYAVPVDRLDRSIFLAENGRRL